MKTSTILILAGSLGAAYYFLSKKKVDGKPVLNFQGIKDIFGLKKPEDQKGGSPCAGWEYLKGKVVTFKNAGGQAFRVTKVSPVGGTKCAVYGDAVGGTNDGVVSIQSYTDEIISVAG